MKSGIDFFPLDVSLDNKFKLIEAEFGVTGFGVVVHLLQEIYGQEGYYIEWTEEVALLFAQKYGVGYSAVSEIVSASIRRGMFDKEIFDKYHILTSRGIQKRYFDAVSRRKVLEVREDILLVDIAQILKNVNIEFKNANISGENDDISEQSKVKESKVKESKVNKYNTPTLPDEPKPQEEAVCRKKDVEAVVNAWNTLGLSQVKKVMPDTNRGKLLKRRILDYGIEDVLEAVEKVRNSPFLTGHNDKGWVATFDWFISPNNFPKVLSGNYDNHEPAQPQKPQTPQRPPDASKRERGPTYLPDWAD